MGVEGGVGFPAGGLGFRVSYDINCQILHLRLCSVPTGDPEAALEHPGAHSPPGDFGARNSKP